jgi:hypothetical protein
MESAIQTYMKDNFEYDSILGLCACDLIKTGLDELYYDSLTISKT